MRTLSTPSWILLISIVSVLCISESKADFLQRSNEATSTQDQPRTASGPSSLPKTSQHVPDDSQPLRLLDDEIADKMFGFIPRSPPDGSLFTWESIVDEPYDTVFNQTFADLVKDYNNEDNCQPERWHADTLVYMQQVMQFWSDLAKRERIPYMLTFGSLLGYARNKNYTPYDADMDVFVPTWAHDRLLKYTTPLPIDNKYDREKFLLHLHPEFRHVALSERRRYPCSGGVSDFYEDLFALDHLPRHNMAVVSKDHVVVSKPEVFFPPRPCTFFGVQLFCPNDYIKAIRAWYGPTTEALRPSRLCIDGEWQTAQENPQTHAAVLKKWKERVGPIAAAETDDVDGLWEHKSAKRFCNELNPKMDPLENGICNFYVPRNK